MWFLPHAFFMRQTAQMLFLYDCRDIQFLAFGQIKAGIVVELDDRPGEILLVKHDNLAATPVI